MKKNFGGGRIGITCPFESEHTTGAGDGDCVYFLPHTNGFSTGNFNCFHAHCAERPQADFLRAIGLEPDRTAKTAKTATATAPDENWPDPLSLAPNERAEPYPADALPGAIGDAVEEVTGFVQCPLPLTACSAMAAISTVAAGLVDVQRAGNLCGPSGLFFLALAESGERKTTVDGFFTKGIRQWEAEQEETHRPVLQAWRAADAAWTAERDGLVLAIKDAAKRGKPTTELKEKLCDHEACRPVRPMVPRLLIGDATSEALTWRLANRWPVGGILNSEGGICPRRACYGARFHHAQPGDTQHPLGRPAHGSGPEDVGKLYGSIRPSDSGAGSATRYRPPMVWTTAGGLP